MGKKLIIDVDTGIDDSHAIMLALSCPEVEVVAITCVNGNTDVDKACRNTFHVLDLCGRLDIPVFRGAERPLVFAEELNASHFHGVDGLGGIWPDQSDCKIQSEHAVLAMGRLVNENKGEITLVALAPLTNVAMALKMDLEFGKKLKEICIMGGNIEGKGNATLGAEFNFAGDPEAASICLDGLKNTVSIVPWETCLHQAIMPWAMYDKWINMESPKAKYFEKSTQYWVNDLKMKEYQAGFTSCDLFAMATVLFSDIVLQKEEVYAIIELHGHWTRGQMVVDWRKQLGREPNITIIKSIDQSKVDSIVTEMLK